MPLKKSQLYSSLWKSCDELRGGMDASQYKDYVLTLLFMKYVSDKHACRPDALIDVPAGGGFADMVKLKGDKEIGDKINKIIARLAEANDLKGVIDQADFNDESKLGTGKEMQDRLSTLVAIFDGLDFGANRPEGDDLLGDAYEYLMQHFATESGKSKGQFYTPAEVSRVMAQVVGIGPETRQDQTIYDPACGSGSLLLKAADEAPGGITVYGQEMDNATWALARMNLILHGHETADLWRGNTLAVPYFKNPDDSLKTFDFAVANPPFSAKAWSSGLDPANDVFRRFEYGIPPARNGDYAFLLHLVTSLKSKGKGAIILPHGVLFRGNREADIRRNLVRRGLIKGVIGLPANLFYGTGIPACILVIDKENAHARTGIFMIDASKGFRKDGNKNRLRSQDIHRIVDVFNKQTELPRYSRMVPVAETANPANGYNLNIPRYIDSGEPEDLHDLDAHLNGGIPDRDIYQRLMDYWDETMQDDVYLIAADGWREAAKPRGIIEDKDKKIKETPDLTIKRKKYKMDLIPPALIVARWFAEEQAAIGVLKTKQEAAARDLEEFVEEHTGEEALLEEAVNDKGEITKTRVTERLKAIKNEPESDEERYALKRCLALIEAESKAGKAVKEAQAALDDQVVARYATLTEAEIKSLVVEDKWLAGIRAAIEGEVQRLTQQIAGRVKVLEERYAWSCPVSLDTFKLCSKKFPCQKLIRRTRLYSVA